MNDLYTNDGLRAAAAERWEVIPALVARASAVRGCPHLNSGGLRLDLVRVLLSKKRQLYTAQAYLDAASAFGGDRAELRLLGQKLKLALAHSRSRGSRRESRSSPSRRPSV